MVYPDGIETGIIWKMVGYGVFDGALVKLQQNILSDVTDADKRRTWLLSKAADDVGSSGTAMAIVERASKRARTSKLSQSIYMNTPFHFPTANLCELLLSKAGYSSTDLSSTDCRKGILLPILIQKCSFQFRVKNIPSNFESKMFLHVKTACKLLMMPLNCWNKFHCSFVFDQLLNSVASFRVQ